MIQAIKDLPDGLTGWYKLTNDARIKSYKNKEELLIAGEDSFLEVANDFGSFTEAAKKKILREVSNAVNDAVTTQKNEAVTIDVLDNDEDTDGGTPVITGINTNSSDGTAEIVNGEISYTPASDSLATDTFYYTISDGQDRFFISHAQSG
ncbi:MAG: Ig-like domain-containing protein [Cyanobacteria bacterium P01_G01_bin.39]